jgi:ribosomal-protein-alanine N-acetyltransferase
LPAVAALEGAVFTDPWSTASLRSSLAGPALVAEGPGGDVVGYLFLQVAADQGEILNLAVHPAHRRRGVARRLTEVALSQFGHRGVRTAYLEVRRSNHGAQAFYERMGFRPVGLRRGYYRRPREDALVLGRSIAPATASA